MLRSQDEPLIFVKNFIPATDRVRAWRKPDPTAAMIYPILTSNAIAFEVTVQSFVDTRPISAPFPGRNLIKSGQSSTSLVPNCPSPSPTKPPRPRGDWSRGFGSSELRQDASKKFQPIEIRADPWWETQLHLSNFFVLGRRCSAANVGPGQKDGAQESA